LCICLFSAITAACSKPLTPLDPVTPPELNSDAQAVVIDTDMATEDAMAILYLLGRTDVDVKAIIVARDGLAHWDNESGRTIESDDGYPMRVATSANGDAFQTLFLDILNGRTSTK